MKKILVVSSLLIFGGLFFVGCKKAKEEVSKDTEKYTQRTKGSSEDLLIRPGIGVGKIEFGMTVQQMKDILGKPDVAGTGISYMYTSLGIEIVAKGKVTISAILCGNPSNRKDLPMLKAMEEACKFKTAEGIGIGSTEVQVLKAFGQPTRRRDDTLLYKNKRISFSLANDKVIGIWVGK